MNTQNHSVRDPSASHQRNDGFGSLFYLTLLYFTFLLTSLVVDVKIVDIDGDPYPASIVVYPLTYVLMIIIAEVASPAQTRKIIHSCFLVGILCSGFLWVVDSMPQFDSLGLVDAGANAFGFNATWSIATLIGFLAGQYTAAFLLVWGCSRWLTRLFVLRVIVATVLGLGVDSILHFIVAVRVKEFSSDWFSAIWHHSWPKAVYVICFIPVMYVLIRLLKRRIAVDPGNKVSQ